MTDRQVLIDKLAREFSKVLREWLSLDEMQEVVRRNRTPQYVNACATHDFCDANMAMDQAFKNLGVEPPDGLECVEALQLWDAAWDAAKINEFYLNGGESL